MPQQKSILSHTTPHYIVNTPSIRACGYVKDSCVYQYIFLLQTFGKEAIGTAGLVIIPLLVSASAFGAANASVFSASRVVFEAARDGHAPKFLSGLHATAKTPVPAIILQVSRCTLAALFKICISCIRMPNV